jgi:hypothetical protein
MARFRLLAILVAAGAALTIAPGAASAANDHAACLGVASSLLAGDAGARADTAQLILAISPEATGQPPGAFYVIFAQRHPGGEFDC